MRTKLFAGVAFAALYLPVAAHAQSTGSIDFEESEIVVTGQRDASVGGVEVPETPKSRVVINSELIRRQRPGQTVNDIINLSPGVSFQNNDATGAAGGTFTIRGFDSTRISQTVDGIPLNDTGNYAIYTNQQQDPETLDSVSVTLGSTDVDSPTASAVGGTVNIRTRVPGDELGALFSGTYGQYVADGSGTRNIFRAFGMIDTGDFTGFGTKAFFSASVTNADQPFNNYGKLNKQQYNGRIYQEIGSNGDFVSVAGHYNQNRNNFFGSVPLRYDSNRVVGTGSGNRFPLTKDERFYNINYPCNTDTPQAGVADTTNSCGTEFDRRYNPSNTGNIRGNSRFTLFDGLVLTIDPSFQYVKANGGGTVTGREGGRTVNGTTFYGYSGNSYYTGVDLNGDGDTLDQVTVLAPSQTTTRRYIVIGNLSYDISPLHRVRLNYTFDRGRHRQTGELGYIASNGEPFDVFPKNDPILDVNGNAVQKRDRLSYATLNQVAAEYRGKFLGDALTVNLGLTQKWFQRDLNQHCFTTSASGFVDCIASSQVAAYAAANPYNYNSTTNAVSGYAAPQSRTYKYDKLLPNVGLTFQITPAASIYASYAKNISVPGTDTLYNSFYYPEGTEQARPAAETTDSFEGGFRYNTGNFSAQLGGWYTKYKNRIASAYDPELDQVITRNLGGVTKWGIDGNVSFKPIPEVLLYVFGSYLNSEIDEDLLGGNCTSTMVTNKQYGCSTAGAAYYVQTGGKREAGAPEYTLGGRIQGTLGPVDLGVQAKYTGRRWLNDENLPVYQLISGTYTQVYGATASGYTTVDLDIRYNLEDAGLPKSYLQLNVSNLFDEFYVGGVSGQSNRYSTTFAQIGVPRAITASLVVGF
ncbi:MAG: TonB-dependent receptor [Pseudomonadota bacterium]